MCQHAGSSDYHLVASVTPSSGRNDPLGISLELQQSVLPIGEACGGMDSH
jgi:hypothetical protein